MTASQLRALFELFRGAGVHRVDCTSGEPYWVLWNNRTDPGLRYRFEHWPEHVHLWYDFPFEEETGLVPRFHVIRSDELKFKGRFRLRVNYDDYLTIEERG
jgi:hypothetical protein